MIGRVNVRIFDQIVTLLVRVDARDAVVDITATDDGTDNTSLNELVRLSVPLLQTLRVLHIYMSYQIQTYRSR
jgi:hypothetical protein